MIQRAYVDQAKVVLAENFRPNDPDGSMTAASAAYILKRLVGRFEDAGFFKFKELLDVLESDGFLKTGKNSKDAFSLKLSAVPASFSAPTFHSHARLRADVWYAFVKSEPKGRRFFDPDSGQVRARCETSPGDSWIEIAPIDPETEKERAIKFLENNHISIQDAIATLDDPNWYITFPEFLRSISVLLASQWKRERSIAVVATVEEWRERHSIKESLVYESRQTIETRFTSPSTFAVATAERQESLRQALLNAISKMSVDELLEIRIPASHLVGELRPDLLK